VYRDDCEFYEKERGDMTREKAIEIIECGDIYNRWGDDGKEVEQMAIKALEQEQKTDVLDKIRDEIRKHCERYMDGDIIADEVIQAVENICKAESEEL
jgi:hypothetical protein